MQLERLVFFILFVTLSGGFIKISFSIGIHCIFQYAEQYIGHFRDATSMASDRFFTMCFKKFYQNQRIQIMEYHSRQDIEGLLCSSCAKLALCCLLALGHLQLQELETDHLFYISYTSPSLRLNLCLSRILHPLELHKELEHKLNQQSKLSFIV